MEQKITILFARPWSLTDEKTGQLKEGCTLQFLMTDTLKPCKAEDGSEYGYQPTKQSISIDLAKKLVNVPGIYNGTFTLRTQQQKAVLTLTDIDFVK